MFGPNHILVTLRWDDGRSPSHKNVWNLRWLLLKYIQINTESVKTKKLCVSWKIFEIEFKSSKFPSITPKALCLGASEPTKRLAAQSTAYVLRNRQGKQAFVKENEKIYS